MMNDDPDRDEKGKFVKGHKANHRNSTLITPDNARELQKKSVEARKRNQQAANDRAMMLGVKSIATEDINKPEDAAAYMVGQQAVLGASPDLSPHASTKAAEFVLRETGRLQERQRDIGKGGVTVFMGEDLARDVLGVDDKSTYLNHSVEVIDVE
jgi:hypothetical protein